MTQQYAVSAQHLVRFPLHTQLLLIILTTRLTPSYRSWRVLCPHEVLVAEQVPLVRRQSAFDEAPPEHSMALSAFRRRTAGAATHSTHSTHSTDALRTRAALRRGGPQPQRSEPLTLEEVSAAVRAAKRSAASSEGTAEPVHPPGAVLHEHECGLSTRSSKEGCQRAISCACTPIRRTRMKTW